MARQKSRHKQRFPHLLGSKWTSVRPVLGWRHFQVKERQQGDGGLVFAELEAVCNPQVRIWVNASALKNRELWQAGWTPLQDGIPCGPESPEHNPTHNPPKHNPTHNSTHNPTKKEESGADWSGI